MQGEMQQKLCSRGSSCSLFSEQNGQSCGAGAPPPLPLSSSFSSPSVPPLLPFRCPRCGEKERFRSLASLRAHLEHRHAYHSACTTVNPETPPWHETSLPTRRRQHPPWRSLHVRSLSDSRQSSYAHGYDSGRRRTQSVGVGTQDQEEGETEDCAASDDQNHYHHPPLHHRLPSASLTQPPPEPGPRTQPPECLSPGQSTFPGLEPSSSSAAAVQRRLASVLRAADSTMQRKLARVSTELARTDTELVCQLAHSQHLAQERQEVAERERALSRQVDVAVMVIATLREELNASENELERREREVITIQNFLESAARHETCGKVRIQHFIENLLKRIALAERLLDYYQSNGSPTGFNHCMGSA
ncbi:protein ZNF365 [Aplochiton taeniatus]